MDPVAFGKKIKETYPQYANVDDAVLGQKYMQKYGAAVSSVQGGQLDIKDIPEKQRIGVGLGLQAVGYESPENKETKEKEQEKQQSKKIAVSLVDDLLNRDTGAITGIPNPLKSLTGENQYTKNLVDQLNASLSVEAREKMKGTGQISDYESELLQKSVSALNTNLSNKDFKTELRRIKAVLEGTDPESTIGGEEGNVLSSLFNTFVKDPAVQLKNYAQDVGVGMGLKGETGDQLAQSQSQAVEQANRAYQKAKEIEATDPEQAARLRKVADEGLAQVGASSSELQKLFSPDIEKDYVTRGIETGANITALAGLASPVVSKAIPSLAGRELIPASKTAITPVFSKKISSLLNKAPSGEKTSFLGKLVKKPIETIFRAGKSTELQKNARVAIAKEAEEQGIKIGSKGTQSIAKKMVDNKFLPEKVRPLIEKLAKGESLNPTEALDLMVASGKRYFTTGGNVRMSRAADFFGILQEEIRKEFSSKASGIIAETVKIGQTLGARKALKTGATTTGLTAGAIGGGAYLLSLFRGK